MIMPEKVLSATKIESADDHKRAVSAIPHYGSQLCSINSKIKRHQWDKSLGSLAHNQPSGDPTSLPSWECGSNLLRVIQALLSFRCLPPLLERQADVLGEQSLRNEMSSRMSSLDSSRAAIG